jgi:hypothetical protein
LGYGIFENHTPHKRLTFRIYAKTLKRDYLENNVTKWMKDLNIYFIKKREISI